MESCPGMGNGGMEEGCQGQECLERGTKKSRVATAREVKAQQLFSPRTGRGWGSKMFAQLNNVDGAYTIEYQLWPEGLLFWLGQRLMRLWKVRWVRQE